MDEEDEIWAGIVGQTWNFTLPTGTDITYNTFHATVDEGGSALTIEMLYDTIYKMTGDPKYFREKKLKVVFEDVTATLP